MVINWQASCPPSDPRADFGGRLLQRGCRSPL